MADCQLFKLPSSINRVYALIHPGNVPPSYEYAAGVVLSLMGFWNSVIYIATSRAACKSILRQIFLGESAVKQVNTRRFSESRGAINRRRSVSISDSTQGLANTDGTV